MKIIFIRNESKVLKGLEVGTVVLHMAANQPVLAIQTQHNASNVFLFPAGAGRLRRPALTGNEI